ncbi:hypothetical protein OH76DRAFT_1455413 [Lentinus brumalis]|uniref:Uncharacterized protein n=1 Tax=Lentinus brumalis TaxID=2498619 RepID=A0A371DDD8_9APHY|nr:hypothetical protein OH76DRAFT_1455413 [Polyporus brumalis]
MRLHRDLLAYVAAFAVVGVRANTEIVNFVVSPGRDADLPLIAAWPELLPHDHERLVSMQPAPVDTPITNVCEPITAASPGKCPHEQWVSLGLDHPAWVSYLKFTLRVSWPASHPADFYIDTYTPEALARLVHGDRASDYVQPAGQGTRRMFARIRVVSGGVLTPGVSHNATLQPVPFIVTVEPLLFGVLPGSVIPTVACLLFVGLAAGLLVFPRVSRYLGSVAELVRVEQTVVRSRKET